MARRFIGDATIYLRWRDRGDYAGTIVVPAQGARKRAVWAFAELVPPKIWGPVQVYVGMGCDSPEAYDQMAGAAVGFGSYYTSDNRGPDIPDWAPTPEVADAISEAVAFAQDDSGEYAVERRAARAKKRGV